MRMNVSEVGFKSERNESAIKMIYVLEQMEGDVGTGAKVTPATRN